MLKLEGEKEEGVAYLNISDNLYISFSPGSLDAEVA